MTAELDPTTEVEELAAVLYRTDWQADLYATPRGSYTYRYERRAEKVLVSDWLKKRDTETRLAALNDAARFFGYAIEDDRMPGGLRSPTRQECYDNICDLVRAVRVRKDGEGNE